MRKWHLAAAVLTVAGIPALSAGCEPAPLGELVLIVKTDMAPPKDFNKMRIQVFNEGALKFNYEGPVPGDPADEQRIVLLTNGRESLENPDFDPAPVVKLFTPDAGATWLLTEIDPDDHDHAFGLCDLGLGAPEIGWVSLGELATVRGGLGLPIERDLSFRAEKRLSAYARDARLAGRIASASSRMRASGRPLSRSARSSTRALTPAKSVASAQ